MTRRSCIVTWRRRTFSLTRPTMWGLAISDLQVSIEQRLISSSMLLLSCPKMEKGQQSKQVGITCTTLRLRIHQKLAHHFTWRPSFSMKKHDRPTPWKVMCGPWVSFYTSFALLNGLLTAKTNLNFSRTSLMRKFNPFMDSEATWCNW